MCSRESSQYLLGMRLPECDGVEILGSDFEGGRPRPAIESRKDRFEVEAAYADGEMLVVAAPCVDQAKVVDPVGMGRTERGHLGFVHPGQERVTGIEGHRGG